MQITCPYCQGPIPVGSIAERHFKCGKCGQEFDGRLQVVKAHMKPKGPEEPVKFSDAPSPAVPLPPEEAASEPAPPPGQPQPVREDVATKDAILVPTSIRATGDSKAPAGAPDPGAAPKATGGAGSTVAPAPADPPAPAGAAASPSAGASGRRQGTGRQQGISARRSKFIGPYMVLEEISRGGMGIVYKAVDPQLKRQVAIKVLLQGSGAMAEDIQRFRREAEAAARLRHPNIVPIHAVGTHEGRPYLVMDFIEGRTLKQLIEDRSITPRLALSVCEQTGDALHYAHQQGIVHRDVKPANIMLDQAGNAHIMDFGLAKRVDEHDLYLTKAGTTMGTPAYMSPEQARGDLANVDAQSDTYSIGAVLYEMLTYRPPFEGTATMAVLLRVIDEEPDPPRKINPRIHKDIETICLKAMEKEKVRRYATAGALADDIRRFNAGEVISAAPVGPIGRFVRRAIKRIEITLAVIAAVLVLVGALVYVGYKGHQDAKAAADLRHRSIESAIRTGHTKLDKVRETMAGLDPTPHELDEKLFINLSKGLDEAEVELLRAHALDPGNQEAAKELELLRGIRQTISVKKLLIYGYGFMDSTPPNYAGAVVIFRLVLDADPSNKEAKEQLRDALGIRRAAVESAPKGAAVSLKRLSVDDSLINQGDLRGTFPQDLGATPVSVSLPPGKYCLVFRAPGAKVEHEFPLEMDGKAPAQLTVTLNSPHANMALVPAGSVQGTVDTVNVPEFYIDRYEYPNRVGATPAIEKTRIEAAEACKKEGKVLCTTAQWLRACSGPLNYRYPYGENYQANACASGFDQETNRQPFPVGSFSRCRSPFGVYDMVGNVSEWVQATGDEPSARGGSWLDATLRPLITASCRADSFVPPDARDVRVGFRCCMPKAPGR